MLRKSILLLSALVGLGATLKSEDHVVETSRSVVATQCVVVLDKTKAEKVLWDSFVVAPGYNKSMGISVGPGDSEYDKRITEYCNSLNSDESRLLAKAFKLLNHGRNIATNLCMSPVIVNWSPEGFGGISSVAEYHGQNNVMIAYGTPKDVEREILLAVERENELRKKYELEHPEEFVDAGRREIPIALNRALYENKPCWVITCLWESCCPPEGVASLTHVIVYCVNYDGSKLLESVSCD